MKQHSLGAGPLALALALLPALAGCGDGAPTRSAGPASSAAAAAQGAPPPRVTKYDGTYAGPVTATSGAYSCPNAVRGNRSMSINYGRALLDMNPGRGSPLQGLVQEDGSLRATDQIDRYISVTGSVNGEQFVGTWVAGRCVYNLNLRRTG